MSAQQPEALRLADLFEVFGTNELAGKAAAELRRLHAKNAVLVTQLASSLEEINCVTEQRDELLHGRQVLGIEVIQLEAQRDVLLEALREVAAWDKIGAFPRVHAAIAKAEGGA